MNKNLISYLEDKFIPNNIRKNTTFNDYGDEEEFYTISLREIFSLAKNDEDFITIMDYLAKNNIRVFDMNTNNSDYDFPNYETRIIDIKNAKKPYSDEEQTAKFLEYAKSKDPKIFNELFEHNYRFVLYMASKCDFSYRIPHDVALSAAQEGIIDAINKFDASRGAKFTNYAQKAIKSKMLYRAVECYKSGKDTFLVDFLSAKIAVEKEYGQRIDDSVLGREMLDDVLDILEAKGVCVADKKGKRRTREDIRNLVNITNHLSIDDEDLDASYNIQEDDQSESCLYNEDLREELDEVLSSLTSKEQKVLIHRYGLEDDRFKRLQECADYFGVTKQRINQVEKKAFQKIRKSKSSKRLKEFL